MLGGGTVRELYELKGRGRSMSGIVQNVARSRRCQRAIAIEILRVGSYVGSHGVACAGAVP